MNQYTMCFSTNDENIKLNELSNFLYYFRATYALAAEQYSDVTIEALEANLEYYLKEFNTLMLFSGNPKKITNCFFTELNDSEIYFDYANKNSPLTFKGGAMMVALTLAVIVSGGKAKVFGAEFELNPLGDGIYSLRKAFGLAEAEPEPEPFKKRLSGKEQGTDNG